MEEGPGKFLSEFCPFVESLAVILERLLEDGGEMWFEMGIFLSLHHSCCSTWASRGLAFPGVWNLSLPVPQGRSPEGIPHAPRAPKDCAMPRAPSYFSIGDPSAGELISCPSGIWPPQQRLAGASGNKACSSGQLCCSTRLPLSCHS